MEGVTVQALIQTFGPAGLFIAYLIYRAKVDRDDAEKRATLDREEANARRLADIQLALALERFCRRYTGQSLAPPGDNNVHQG